MLKAQKIGQIFSIGMDEGFKAITNIVMILGILGLLFSFLGCTSLNIKDIEPWRLIYSVNEQGQACMFKKITDSKPTCTDIKLITGVDPWKSHALLIHDRNLKEKLIELLDRLQKEALQNPPIPVK